MPYPITNYVTCTDFSISHQHFLAAITKVIKPKYYNEAVKDPQWRKAVKEEIQTLEKNKTCMLQDLPSGKMPISYKWVY